MTRVLYVDVVGGLAGDMVLGALLDAGAPEERLWQVPESLGIGPVGIEIRRVHRHGIGALHVDVIPPDDPPPRTWRRMRELIEEAASLEPRPRERALAVLGRLAEAEAGIHGVPVDDVHFHELGGVDTLVDVCGAAVLVEALRVERIVCSPVPYVRGLSNAAHGVLPLPAPATLAVLRGAQLEGREGEKEVVTPTGAAIASTLADSYGPLPPLELERVGYGAGTDDPPDRPNVLRVVVGEEARSASDVVVLEANLDDMSPELVPDAVERCFAAGALDVWTVPVLMKKGRPGIVLTALSRPESATRVSDAILRETTSLGVRVTSALRYELAREERRVDVSGGTIRVKLGFLGGRIVNVAPEHDDCAAVARATGRPVKDVWAEALAAARRIGS